MQIVHSARPQPIDDRNRGEKRILAFRKNSTSEDKEARSARAQKNSPFTLTWRAPCHLRPTNCCGIAERNSRMRISRKKRESESVRQRRADWRENSECIARVYQTFSFSFPRGDDAVDEIATFIRNDNAFGRESPMSRAIALFYLNCIFCNSAADFYSAHSSNLYGLSRVMS